MPESHSLPVGWMLQCRYPTVAPLVKDPERSYLIPLRALRDWVHHLYGNILLMSASPVPAFLPFPTSLPLPVLPGNAPNQPCIQSLSHALLSGNSPSRHIHWKEWRELSRCENCFLPLMFSVFESVIVCVKHATGRLYCLNKSLLLVASHVFLLNSTAIFVTLETLEYLHVCTSQFPLCFCS